MSVTISHIKGSRVPMTFRMVLNNVPIDLSTYESIKFLGTATHKSNTTAVIDEDFTSGITQGQTELPVYLADLIDEDVDLRAKGRFLIGISGTIKPTAEIYIEVIE